MVGFVVFSGYVFLSFLLGKLSFGFRVYGLGFRVLSIRGLGLLTLQSSASGLAISAGILKKLPR